MEAACHGGKVGGAGHVHGGGDPRATRPAAQVAGRRQGAMSARCRGGKAGGAGDVPGGGDAKAAISAARAKCPAAATKWRQGRRRGRRARQQRIRPGALNIMIDIAAMGVDDGNLIDDAHVAHAVVGVRPQVDRFTDLQMLYQLQPCGSYYADRGPVEVVDGIPAIAGYSLYDACVHNRALLQTGRIQTRYEAQPGFVDWLAESGTPNQVGDRVPEVGGDRFNGNEGPQRRVYEVLSFCSNVVRNPVPLHLFHRLV